MKKKEFKDLNTDEIRDKLSDLRKKLMELSFQRKVSHVEKPHLFKETKKDIARLLTLLSKENK